MTSKRRVTAGKRLRRQLDKALPEGFEWTEKELEILSLAERQADDIQRLEWALEDQGLTVLGAAGQPRMNPIITEVRQQRLALSRLLGEVRLPDEVDVKRQRSVNERWRRERARRGEIA